MKKKLIIAIDGPAASGKSTTAKLVASHLGYIHLDTGAMYRAMTLKVLQNKINLQNISAIIQLAQSTSIRLLNKDGKLSVFLDDKDVTEQIRTVEVTKNVSTISAIPTVREIMVEQQRVIGKQGGVVLEGRDIATVVFPNADVKIFMTADVRARAVRRAKELEAKGTNVSITDLEKEIAERDAFDSTRSISPLKKAKDAIVLDTTNLTVKEQAEFIIQQAKEKV